MAPSYTIYLFGWNSVSKYFSRSAVIWQDTTGMDDLDMPQIRQIFLASLWQKKKKNVKTYEAIIKKQNMLQISDFNFI